MVAGWPACLRAVAATALLVKEADKLTLGQELVVTVPHAVETLLWSALELWMSDTRITQFQALLHQVSQDPGHQPCQSVARQ